MEKIEEWLGTNYSVDNWKLEGMIDNATDINRWEADLNLNLEICELVNKKGSGWPRDAAVLVLKILNSKSAQSGLLALTLLDNLVKNCGTPFQMQIGHKEFLTGLTRKFPEHPPSIVSPVQYRILELLQEWNATLAQGRYASDFRHVRAVCNQLSYRGYRFTDFNADTSVLKERPVLRNEKELEDEDRKHQEAKLQDLLRRKTPEALAEANEIMKTLAGYDLEARPNYKKQFLDELSKIEVKARELQNFLATATQMNRLDEHAAHLFNECKSAQTKIQNWVAEEDDAESTARLLAVNDILNEVTLGYQAFKSGKHAMMDARAQQGLIGTAAAATSVTPVGVITRAQMGGVVQNVRVGPEPLSANGGANKLESPAKPISNIVDDLLGISFMGPSSSSTSSTSGMQPSSNMFGEANSEDSAYNSSFRVFFLIYHFQSAESLLPPLPNSSAYGGFVPSNSNWGQPQGEYTMLLQTVGCVELSRLLSVAEPSMSSGPGAYTMGQPPQAPIPQTQALMNPFVAQAPAFGMKPMQQTGFAPWNPQMHSAEATVQATEATVLEKNGLRFTLRKSGREGYVSTYVAVFWNAIPLPMSGLDFQVAVPKSLTFDDGRSQITAATDSIQRMILQLDAPSTIRSNSDGRNLAESLARAPSNHHAHAQTSSNHFFHDTSAIDEEEEVSGRMESFNEVFGASAIIDSGSKLSAFHESDLDFTGGVYLDATISPGQPNVPRAGAAPVPNPSMLPALPSPMGFGHLGNQLGLRESESGMGAIIQTEGMTDIQRAFDPHIELDEEELGVLDDDRDMGRATFSINGMNSVHLNGVTGNESKSKPTGTRSEHLMDSALQRSTSRTLQTESSRTTRNETLRTLKRTSVSLSDRSADHDRRSSGFVATASTRQFGPQLQSIAVHDVLAQNRIEIQKLQEANDMLMRTNDEARKALDAAVYEKEKAVMVLKSEHEAKVEELKRDSLTQITELQTQLTQFQSDLLLARTATANVSHIRATLQREKELDVLTARKEILAQKERQLQELRRDMNDEVGRVQREWKERERLWKQQKDMMEDEAGVKEAELERAKGECLRWKREAEQARDLVAAKPGVREAWTLAVDGRIPEMEQRLNNAVEEVEKTRRKLASLAQVFSDDSERISVLSVDQVVSIVREAHDAKADQLDRLEAELHGKEQVIALLRREQPGLLSSKVAEARAAMERAHSQQVQSLQVSHAEEISTIRATHDSYVRRLKAEHETQVHQFETTIRELTVQVEQSVAARVPSSLNEFQEMYPRELASYKAQIDAEHQQELGELMDRQEQDNAALVERLDAEKNELIEKHAHEIQDVATRIKAQCATAYSNAIEKLKTEYSRLEKRLTAKFERETRANEERAASDIKRVRDEADHERQMLEYRLNEEIDERITNARREARELCRKEEEAKSQAQVGELEAQIASLKERLLNQSTEHSQALSEAKERFLRDQQTSLLKMKEKYLSTLKAMRDDVAASKKRSLERLEAEWQRRKHQLEDECEHKLVHLNIPLLA
ncbi:hypothetical protein HDU93_001692 [Gonapodya sp. JEL0774]|nr:hypothetical protein HDU93_001692 [Gonapodya sp. JEL0774]